MKYLSLTSLFLATSVSAQMTMLSPGSVGVSASYFNPNARAAKYVFERGITDPTEIRYFHHFFNGLDTLGLTSNVLYACSFRSQHNAQSGTNIFPMFGPITFNMGGATNYDGGYVFDGTGSAYLQISNTFGAKFNSATLIAAFKCAPATNAYSSIFGGYETNAGAKGLFMFANGSPQTPLPFPGTSFNFWSGDGNTNGNGVLSQPGLTNIASIYGGPQFSIASFSSTNVANLAGIDRIQETAVTGYTYSNNATKWSVGRTSSLGTSAMVGEVAFVMLLNTNISQYTQHALRRLYTRTLGMGYIPRVNFFIDGTTETANTAQGNYNTNQTWPQLVGTNAILGYLTARRVMAASNTTHAVSAARATNEVAQFFLDNDYAINQYYLDFVSLNDLAVTNANAAQTLFTNKTILWTWLRQQGIKVVAASPIYTTLINATNQHRLNWTNYCVLLRNSPRSMDRFVDLANDGIFRNYTDVTYFMPDGITLNSQGHKYLENTLGKVINYP